MMRANSVKAKWRAGEVTFGAWLSIPDAYAAETMAQAAFDWICIDMQHGIVDYRDAVGMLRAIGATDAVPFVRVPWNEPGIIGKVLDAGAYGVIIPMVNTVAEAEAAVAACRYAPAGRRSFGPNRVPYYAGADYYEHADREIACIPMIETKTALATLDDILSVPGIDAVYVGPADMSITLGLPPRMDNEGAFAEARATIAAACRRRGIIAGIHANAQLAAGHREAGYQMITIASDVGGMARAAREDLAFVRAAPAATAPVYT
jgi:4-hydroxy-2-oxoheptanedioate aldolase